MVIINSMAQAVTVLQDGTVGRIYKSAPTVFINYMAHSGSICAMTILFQQSHVRVGCINLMAQAVGVDLHIRPNALRLYR